MAILSVSPRTAIQKLQADALPARPRPAGVLPRPTGLFPAGVAAEAEFGDVDQLTATIREWDHSVAQLGRGTFRGNLALAHTSSLQLYRATWSPAFLVQGRVPPGSVVFGAQCGGAAGAVWRGRELKGGDVLLLESHQELDLQTRGACDMLVLSISADLFARHAETLRGEPLRIAGADRWSMLGRSTVLRQTVHRRMVRHWMTLLQSALRLGDDLCNQQIAAQVEAETLEMLLVHAAPPTRERPLAERRRAALRARQYMVLNIDEPLTIHDICQAVHACERTLHLGFREAYGITPKRFLKTLRLNAIHRDLRRAEPHQTVTSLACRRGFFHFSNFAADYRRLFGELPSQTLQRRQAALGAAGLTAAVTVDRNALLG